MSRAWIAAALLLVSLSSGGQASIAGGTSGVSTPKGPASIAGPSKEWPVSDLASFDKALSAAKSGDTIQLQSGLYPVLSVTGKKFGAPLTIAGTRKVLLAGLLISGSSNVVVSGVTITPPESQRAVASITGSTGITLQGILVDGHTEAVGAWIFTEPNDGKVTVKDSEVTNCGASNRCVAPGASDLQILHNDFHDCLDCDFIRGQAGGSTLIADNSFDRAIPGACTGGSGSCNHNDIVQVLGGGPWTIVRNRFGDVRKGAASVFISTSTNNTTNRIHDVTVASNLFKSSDSGYFGMQISAGGIPGAPLNVSVVNNTILSGSAAAMRLGRPWADMPREQRPLVANNIFAKSLKNGLCDEARTSHNLVVQGEACPGDFAGPANLNSDAAPTAQSSLVRDRADPSYAPATDYYGHARKGAPDIGAIEFGSVGVQPFALTAPRSMTRSRAFLKKHGWKVSVPLKLTGVQTLRTRVLLRSKAVLTKTSKVSGLKSVTVTLVLPVRARTASQLKLEFRATAPDGRKLVRTTILHLRA